MAEAVIQYIDKKVQRALSVETPGVEAEIDRAGLFRLATLEHHLIQKFWGGPFYYTLPDEPHLPSVNLVFVEDKNGNTGSDEPWNLGGGETDFMIYEGASRVHADAILAGAETVKGIILSVWHPELVQFRTKVLGKKRHPINVITTRRGSLNLEEEIVFNNPDLEVVVLTTDSGKQVLDPQVGERSWVHIESMGEESNLRRGLEILRRNYGVEILSVIGGRTVATDLLNEGLVHDLYLTRTPIEAAPEDTPFYLGDRGKLMESFELVVRKLGLGPEKGVVFEHYKSRKSPSEEVKK